MTLTKYFFKRFFKYTFVIGFFLAFLINFIEFFEKIVHIKQTSIKTVLMFVSLNFIPSFFDLLGVSCWLATCFLIKELYQQNEWDTLALLSINYKILFKFFLSASLCLTIISASLRESFVENIIFLSDQFKMKNFKQQSTQKILNKWFMVDTDMIAYFGALNLSTSSGSNLLLLYVNPDFSIQKVISCSTFFTCLKTKELIIQSGTEFDVENNLSKKIDYLKIVTPALFHQIKINLEVPTTFNLIKNLINKNILPHQVQRELFYQLLNRILFYLKLTLYPLLTLTLFILFWHTSILKWIAILFPYPLFLFISLISDFLFTRGINFRFLLILYMFIILSMWLMYRRISRPI